MVRSMTGYGRVQRTIDGYNILFEVKSVNNRYFDFSARLPRAYGYLEGRLKACVQKYISRGKTEVSLSVEPVEGGEGAVTLNTRLAEGYMTALGELRDRFGLRDDITASVVARCPDIFTVARADDDEEKVWSAVSKAAEEALGGFNAMRTAEGERLREDISARIALISDTVSRIEERSPQTVSEYREKLTERMKEILADSKLDENRILLEAALYADKVSVTEETVRLRSHMAAFSDMLGSGEPVGRKLDFLMQEMNREANTIGSKAMDTDMSAMVVDIKAELEKIREQIQNIE
jgi:uncharacterized protein (TIGR00255 family)